MNKDLRWILGSAVGRVLEPVKIKNAASAQLTKVKYYSKFLNSWNQRWAWVPSIFGLRARGNENFFTGTLECEIFIF